MIHALNFSTCYPLTFVSELVRRQRARYEVPFVISNQESQASYEHFMQREPDLTLRWIPAFSEDGKGYLRMEYSQAKPLRDENTRVAHPMHPQF